MTEITIYSKLHAPLGELDYDAVLWVDDMRFELNESYELKELYRNLRRVFPHASISVLGLDGKYESLNGERACFTLKLVETLNLEIAQERYPF